MWAGKDSDFLRIPDVRKSIRLCLNLMIIKLLFFALVACETPQSRSRKRMSSVENGLVKAIVFKGEKPEKMKLEERMQYYRVPGASIALIYKHQLEWARGYGLKETGELEPVTAESLFQAGSLSQPVCAAAALRFVEEGHCGLDQDVNQALRSWKIPESELTVKNKVTLRGLLSHSAGLAPLEFRGYFPSEPLPALLQILDGEQPANSPAVYLQAEPFARVVYSEAGYAILQQMLVDLREKPFPEIMQETVLTPLGMSNSSFEYPLPPGLREMAVTGHLREGQPLEEKWHIYPEMAASGLWSTPSDLALFAIEVMKTALGERYGIISPALAREMLTPQKANMGLGFRIEDTDDNLNFHLWGSNEGFECFMVAYPVRGEGAVVMTNSANGSYLIDEILRGVSAVYEWPHFKPEVKPLYRLDPSIYAQYVGKYEVNPDYILEVDHEDYYLVITPSGQAPTRFYVQSSTVFFSTDPHIIIRFERDADRGVTALSLTQRGQVIRANKIE